MPANNVKVPGKLLCTLAQGTSRVSVLNLSRKCAGQQFHLLKIKAACVTVTCENEWCFVAGAKKASWCPLQASPSPPATGPAPLKCGRSTVC